MAYRRNTSRFGIAPRNRSGPVRNQSQSTYNQLQTSTRRHQVAYNVTGSTSISAGNYVTSEIIKMRRAFTASSDSPPTATASNNFQSNSVMNGSYVRNLQMKVTAESSSASAAFDLDVYTIALSYYDALIWNTINSANCPVTFDTTSTGPPDRRGEVAFKTPTATLITRNAYNNYKHIQHYMKKIGTLHFTASDGGDNAVTFTLSGIPKKCRRMQTGTFYGICFVNDSDANNAGVFTGNINIELSFDEIPSENRMPYLD